VLPGAIATESLKERIESDADPASLESLIVERTLAKRMATPEEIGCFIAFLVSGQADYIIGSPLLIDGGQLAT
jgi:NAD(P)-dependent dehydrogenase (short-subunit alcohol dehydrogenase family)